MTRDYTQFIHRVNVSGNEDFQLTSDIWADLNPDWRVINWPLAQLDEDFSELRSVLASLRGQDDKIKFVYGAALTEHWGGLFIANDEEPTSPLTRHQPGVWATNEHMYFGADEPGDTFFQDIIAKCIRDNDVDIEYAREAMWSRGRAVGDQK